MGGAKLKIDLSAVLHNYRYYKTLLTPETQLLVVSKASSYGNGELDIVRMLEEEGVDYLAVALCDEGVFFRKNDVKSRILVLLTEQEDFEEIVEHCLEPSIFSIELLKSFIDFLKHKKIENYHIHLKMDTGMNRLGIKDERLKEFLKLAQDPQVHVKSVFSHLLASEDPTKDHITNDQIDRFKTIQRKVDEIFDHKIIYHLLNTRGISRFKNAHFDMVRLGIGLYGYSGLEIDDLKSVSILETNILQIKQVGKGEYIGYGGENPQPKDITIAILSIGYADGLARSMGNGNGYGKVNDIKCPFMGNICMDISMIDITDVNCKIGDRVEIFGKDIKIGEIANAMNTIPYEVFTSISKRVKRVFIEGK